MNGCVCKTYWFSALCLELLQRLAYNRLVSLKLGCGDEAQDRQVAYAFWFHSSPALPEVCYDGLQSAVKVARLKVFLLGYQIFKSVPNGVEVMAADQYLEDWFICSVLVEIIASYHVNMFSYTYHLCVGTLHLNPQLPRRLQPESWLRNMVCLW